MSATDLAAAAFRHIGHGVALWSAEGTLLAYNPAFSTRFDCFGGAVPLGITQADFFLRLDRSGLIIRPERAQSTKFNGFGATTLTFSDGTICEIERWPAENGTYVSFYLDVTVAKRSERALERARDLAASADQGKSRFLRAANHDLRQPLASLKILIYSCASSRNEDERSQALHAMDVSCSIMEDLLGALLNIGQLDAGKVTPQVQTFQIATLLERLRVQYEHQAREKGIDLRILPSKVTVQSDRALLERIVSNFVGNAIRYTDVGRVLVGCCRHGAFLRIGVYDTGCGIAEEHHQAIFDEFFRIADGQLYGKHSLGLGLNIAKRLADVLGHPILMHSTLGKGSGFAVDVPIGNVLHSSIGEPEINERIGGEFAGLVALILEDDNNLRNALTTLLERWGIEVQTFNSFDNIPATLAKFDNAPDIIITDYRLRGDVQGTDVVNQVNDILEKPCPAVVVTADTSPDLIASIRSQGFPVLIKPVSPPSLRVIMHNLLFEPELVPEIS